MANTYLKIYLHVVFAVKNRNALLPHYSLGEIHAYMARVLMNMKQAPIIVGGVDDHVHILFSYNGSALISDLVKEVKLSASKFIKEHYKMPYHFEWQRGYACFSYSHSQVEAVKNYIANQEAHHSRMNVREEMCDMLSKYGVNYDERYILTEPQ